MKNIRPSFDDEIQAITQYIINTPIDSELAYDTAYYTLLDSMACAILALKFPACTSLLGPVVPGVTFERGVPIPGTSYQLDPVQAAFNLGALIRWLDFNDTWLAAEWGHPSDNLGAILAVSSYMNQHHQANFTIKDVLTFMIKAHEIQGVLALENSFNAVGLDHVLLVKIASTACAAKLLGLSETEISAAISQAFVDGQALRTYRHLPNTGPRKSWAAGDATSRAVRLALITQQGQMGYPSAITAPTWGFSDVLFDQKPLVRKQAYGSYVMENILWKISFPAEFHAQTAVECAIQLHPEIINDLDRIDTIEIQTQEPGMRIINKEGPLHNPADRDHCIQYMCAIGLIFGELTASHYEDDIAIDPRIDALRERMRVSENTDFSKDYLDPEKRSIGNSIQIFFTDGSSTDKISIEYPIGHRKRREQGIPCLMQKFENSLSAHFDQDKAQEIIACCTEKDKLLSLPVEQFLTIFC